MAMYNRRCSAAIALAEAEKGTTSGTTKDLLDALAEEDTDGVFDD